MKPSSSYAKKTNEPAHGEYTFQIGKSGSVDGAQNNEVGCNDVIPWIILLQHDWPYQIVECVGCMNENAVRTGLSAGDC